MQTCFTTTIAGFQITLDQQADGKYWVNYGKQETGCDTYDQAAKELGRCIMHALSCEGNIVNEE